MTKIWILINVKRGFIEEPEIFFSLVEAKKRKADLIKDFNRDYDEIELFAKTISIR